MDCPRCGTRLTRISLNGERQSVYCERCRFADVESDHTRTSDREETWDDALRRFWTANATPATESNGDAAGGPALDPDDGSDSGSDAPPADDPAEATDAAATGRGDGPPEGSGADTEDGADATPPEAGSENPADADAEEA